VHTKGLKSRGHASDTESLLIDRGLRNFQIFLRRKFRHESRGIITDIVIDRNNGGYGCENNRNRGWSATTQAPCVHLSRINGVYVRSQREQPAYIVNHDEFAVINYAFRPITSCAVFHWLFPLALSYRLSDRNFWNSCSWACKKASAKLQAVSLPWLELRT